jgi:hypothetical protein
LPGAAGTLTAEARNLTRLGAADSKHAAEWVIRRGRTISRIDVQY